MTGLAPSTAWTKQLEDGAGYIARVEVRRVAVDAGEVLFEHVDGSLGVVHAEHRAGLVHGLLQLKRGFEGVGRRRRWVSKTAAGESEGKSRNDCQTAESAEVHAAHPCTKRRPSIARRFLPLAERSAQ